MLTLDSTLVTPLEEYIFRRKIRGYIYGQRI